MSLWNKRNVIHINPITDLAHETYEKGKQTFKFKNSGRYAALKIRYTDTGKKHACWNQKNDTET